MGISNKIGPPVEGDDFYGRKKELDLAWRLVRNGNSLILAAPRRVGKSSFSKKMLERAKKEGWKTLYLNLEEVRTEEAFARLFIDKLQFSGWWEKLKSQIEHLVDGLLKSVKPTVEMGGVQMSVEWKIRKTDVFTKLKKLLEAQKNMLIVIDELVIFLNHLLVSPENIDDVKFFLNWLRSFRQVEKTQIRWIFCSSVGIDNFTEMHGLSHTLNDVSNFQIDEFTREEAGNLVRDLSVSENIEFPEDQRKYMLDKLGWNLPYFIQILFARIHSVMLQEKQVSPEVIDEAYQLLIDDKCLNTWNERLKGYAEYESYARAVLERLSQASGGESRDNLDLLLYARIEDPDKREDVLNKLLRMLRHDGYIIASREKYVFRSPLLRDFWYNRFVK